MREIKFRAWDKRYNEMIYDAHKTYDYGCFGEGSIYSQSFSDILEEVDCEVMQYTGIKDKNGKEIYEGDIVQIPDNYEKFGMASGENYEIDFKDGRFRLKPKYKPNAPGYDVEGLEECKVIGNIYENSELLGDD